MSYHNPDLLTTLFGTLITKFLQPLKTTQSILNKFMRLHIWEVKNLNNKIFPIKTTHNVYKLNKYEKRTLEKNETGLWKQKAKEHDGINKTKNKHPHTQMQKASLLQNAQGKLNIHLTDLAMHVF